MVWVDDLLEKEQQFQELAVKYCVVTLLHSNVKNCCILYTMTYPCIDGTSITSRYIVACEYAMSNIQSGAFLCQANPSTIDTMSRLAKIDKCRRKMDFCDILQYLF